MNPPRVHRLARLLLDLAPGPSRSLEELARAYGISRRTMQRDLRELRRFQIGVRFVEGLMALEPAAHGRIREWMGIATAVEVS
ncbi:MAG: HTH domain-containing protein [Planctomycetes bacterium]|nr:HTH domain-containing protein [Planctomycetota bacterium]